MPLIHSLASHEPVRAMALALLALAVLAGLAVSRMTTRRPSIVLLLACALAILVFGWGTPWHEAFLVPLAVAAVSLPLLSGRRASLAIGASLLLAVVTLDLHWHAGHQTLPLQWRSASSLLPAPAPSAQFLLGRQADGAFRFATVGDTYSLRHQLGGAGGASARQLLLDSESVRLGLDDVAGYNPVHLKTYTALPARLERRPDGRPALRVRPARPDAAAARARRPLLRLACRDAAEGACRSCSVRASR